jgi:putative ABC transport system permease protein
MDELARTALALLVLAVVAGAVPLADGVRQARAVAWAAGRAAVQLLTVGLVLGAVFRAPAAVLPLLAVMAVAATATVAPRLAELPAAGRWRRPAAVAVAVTSGATVTGTVVFASGALPFDVRNVVALGGITLGGAMTASTLAGRRFLAELHGRRPEVEGKLALGLTMRQATADLVAVAVGEALVPALDQTRTTGLVTFPGGVRRRPVRRRQPAGRRPLPARRAGRPARRPERRRGGAAAAAGGRAVPAGAPRHHGAVAAQPRVRARPCSAARPGWSPAPGGGAAGPRRRPGSA